MPIWRNYFDVVILPPPDVWKHAIALSRQLRRLGGEFVLGNRQFLPHISLYHIPVSRKLFPKFSRAVREVAAATKGGGLRLMSIDMPVLMTDRPPWLKRLHRDIVQTTLPYLDWDYGAGELWKTDMLPAHLQAEARDNLRKYGSPMIGRVFRPHITLTSFGKQRKPEKVRLEFERLSFPVAEIAICELGPHHTCQRTIVKYRLGAG
jgi:2'-5' RNA ligase